MFSSRRPSPFLAARVASILLLFASLVSFTLAQSSEPSSETANMTVIVREYDTGDPISQARITLEFFVPRAQRRPKRISYDAKADTQGRCRFSGINEGKIVLTVTASGHQTYGQELQLERNNQVFEVKLKKPQPLL